MGRAPSFSTVVGVVRAYWKGLSLCAAAVAWLLASVTPRFGFVTKLSFGSFLLRTYWPEMLVALVLVGATLILLARFGLKSDGSIAAGPSVFGRAIALVRQVTVSDRVYGLIVVVATVAACVPLLWKQVGLMLEAEQVFYATRLMNWFGDDLHRIAARQINEGQYDAAVRTLEVQARDLGDIEEGRTAENVAASLAGRIEAVERSRQRTLELMKSAGVARSDLLLLGVLQAMLPPHALGAEAAATVPRAETVQAYLAALQRLKGQCDGGTADAATAQDVGMAAAALGFARSPGLLFGPIDDAAQRARLLCEIVAPRTAAQVDALHRAAFSVSAPSERHDWRMPVSGAAGTPGIMVVRSFGRAIDTVTDRAIGVAPLESLLPSMKAGAGADRPLTPVLEASVIAVVAPESAQDKAREDSFNPVTLIEGGARKALQAHARVGRHADGIHLTLCIPSDVAPGIEGYALRMREDGRLQITVTEECAQDAGGSDPARPLDASLLAAIGRFIALIDAGRAAGAPPSARGSLCRVLVAGVREHAPASIGTAINLCPLDAVATGLSLRPMAERR